MFRRRYIELAGIGIGGGLAGWGGNSVKSLAQEDEGDEEDTPDDPHCEPEIQLGERELIIDDSGFTTDAYAAVVVENMGNAASGVITITAEWMDEDGSFLDDDREDLPSLEPGETWIAHVRAIGTDAEDIGGFEASGEFEMGHPRAPQGMSVVESELQTDDISAEITGVAENTREEDLERVEALAKLYDEEGTVIGGGLTFERDLSAGTNWSFEIRLPDANRAEEAAEIEVMLNAGTYQAEG